MVTQNQTSMRLLGSKFRRFCVKNESNKTGLLENLTLYNTRQNVVTKFNKNLRETYFILNKNFRRKKNMQYFGNFCKPYFTNKSICKNEPNTFVENDNFFKKKTLKYLKHLLY